MTASKKYARFNGFYDEGAGQEKKLDAFMATVQGTFAEKIFRDLRFSLFIGWRQFINQMKHTMDSLVEAGVEFTEDEANMFMQK